MPTTKTDKKETHALPISFLFPTNETSLDEIFDSKNLAPFNELTLSFIDDLSKQLMRHKLANQYPDLAALGFWMRKASIKKLHQEFVAIEGEHVRLAKGVVFHIAPSNVDTIFVYSWILSLLLGNANIVRISSKRSPLITILIDSIKHVSQNPNYQPIVNRTAFIQYEHSDTITEHLSLHSNHRVIWGGDSTISKIRQIASNPSAKETIFSNKFSWSLISAKQLLAEKNISGLAKQMYNDAYWFDQMACSSPRLIIWLGETDEIEKAKNRLWSELLHILKSDESTASSAMEKLILVSELAVEGKVNASDWKQQGMARVELKSLENFDRSHHCGGGFFYEYNANTIDAISNFPGQSDQTVTSYGLSPQDIKTFLKTAQPSGIDRIVPIGTALQFSHHWDGYNLLIELSREVYISQ